MTSVADFCRQSCRYVLVDFGLAHAEKTRRRSADVKKPRNERTVVSCVLRFHIALGKDLFLLLINAEGRFLRPRSGCERFSSFSKCCGCRANCFGPPSARPDPLGHSDPPNAAAGTGRSRVECARRCRRWVRVRHAAARVATEHPRWASWRSSKDWWLDVRMLMSFNLNSLHVFWLSVQRRQISANHKYFTTKQEVLNFISDPREPYGMAIKRAPPTRSH